MLLQGSAVSPTFSFTGVNYCAEILELPSGAVSAIIAGSSSPMQMVVPSMRTYTNSAAITTAGTQVSQNIPAKFSSLKSIVVATRSSQGASGLYPNSHCKFGLTSYNFRIGAEILPSTAPTTSAEFFSEVLKCYGSLADLSLQPSIDLISYDLSGNNTVTTSGEASLFDSGSFAVGIDTEVFSNVSKASIFNGTNTNNSDIFFIANYTPNANTTILQTAVATFDQVLVFENGVCYARY